jgi:hypothetical protein
MEQFGKERIGEKEVHRTKKKPYTSPKLTKHGDVDEITEVLRLAGAKGFDGTDIDTGGSDRNAKENFAPVDEREILARLVALSIETWNYKGEDPSVRHIGPMAQDFSKAFGVGEDDKRIHMIDWHIKILQEQVRELQAELAELKKELIPLGG